MASHFGALWIFLGSSFRRWDYQAEFLLADDCDVCPEVNNLNFDTAIKLALAVILRAAKLTCEAKDLENKPVFEHTKFQRRDVTFADNDEHAVLLLRSSKSDHTGVEIVVAKTGEVTCPTRSVYPPSRSPHTIPLRLPRNKYINEIRKRLNDNNHKCYPGHSPRRGAP
ncbi:hypothetical protein V8E54_001280 [Elaphomyces granulatus]